MSAGSKIGVKIKVRKLLRREVERIETDIYKDGRQLSMDDLEKINMIVKTWQVLDKTTIDEPRPEVDRLDKMESDAIIRTLRREQKP